MQRLIEAIKQGLREATPSVFAGNISRRTWSPSTNTCATITSTRSQASRISATLRFASEEAERMQRSTSPEDHGSAGDSGGGARRRRCQRSESSPAYRRVPTRALSKRSSKASEKLTRTLGVQVEAFKAGTPNEIDTAFANVVQRQAGALHMAGDAFFNTRKEQFIVLSARHALLRSFLCGSSLQPAV
jgi:hypothetical protein